MALLNIERGKKLIAKTLQGWLAHNAHHMDTIWLEIQSFFNKIHIQGSVLEGSFLFQSLLPLLHYLLKTVDNYFQ